MKVFSEESALQLSEMLLQNDKDIKTEIEGKIPSVEGLASEEYVDNAVKNVEIDLDGYATEMFVTNAIANAQLGGGDTEVDLSGYATKDDLKAYATKEHSHDEYLTEHQDISGKADTNHKHKMSDITDYEALDLSGYALKSEIPTNYLSSIPDEYVTETEMTEAINNAKLDGESIDLSDYAKKTDIPDTSNFVEKEDGKGLFSGSYDDLTDKPSIPEVYDDTDLDNRIKVIEDDYVKQADIPTTLPASDVYDWAKAETKPEYTADEVGALPSDTEIPSINGLVSEDMLNTTLADYAKTTDVPNNKDILEAITEENIETWNSGGVTDEQVKTAVDDYLSENPIDGSVDSIIDTTTIISNNVLKLEDVAETEKNGVTMTVVDEVITLNGTATANTDLNLSSNYLGDGTYTFAYEILEGSFSGTLKYGYQSSAFIDITTTGATVDIVTHDRTKVRINSGTVCNNLKIHLWAVSGSEYKDWQPYGGWTEKTLNEDIVVKRLEEHIADSDIHITAQEKAVISNLSNVATIYTDKIVDIANKVFKTTDNGAIVTALLTDTHVRPDNTESVSQYKEMVANIAELTHQIPCDGVIHLGDHVNTQWWWANRDTEDLVYQKYVHDYANMLRKANAPVYCIQGNHDGGFIPKDDEAGTTGSEYSSHAIIYRNLGTVTDKNAVRNTVSNIVTPYYYVDNELTKTRMIFMTSNMENSNNDVKGFHYNNLVWLRDTLMDTTDDWNVLIFTHISSARFYTHLTNVDRYIELINAFNEHRVTVDLDSKLTADFSTVTGKIVAEIAGHYHGDSVIYPDNENAKLTCPSIEMDCGSCLVGGGVVTSGDFYDENDTNARSYDDITQHLFDVMVYRPDLNKIYMYRFGAGEDREIDI